MHIVMLLLLQIKKKILVKKEMRGSIFGCSYILNIAFKVKSEIFRFHIECSKLHKNQKPKSKIVIGASQMFGRVVKTNHSFKVKFDFPGFAFHITHSSAVGADR